MAVRRNPAEFEVAKQRKPAPSKIRHDPTGSTHAYHSNGSAGVSGSFCGYKMEVAKPLLDYMCYLEQHIHDTKAQCEREKIIVSGVILNMARLFGLENVTQTSIDQFLDSAVVEGKESDLEVFLQRPDWFEMLQEKRMESFLSDKTKEPEKKEQPSYTTARDNRDNHSSDDFTVPKRKYTKRAQEADFQPRKKRKYQTKELRHEIPQMPPPSPDFMGSSQKNTNPTDYATLLANILEQNGGNVDMTVIGGFEKYINPDLKLTGADNKKLG